MSAIKLPAVSQEEGFSGYLREVWKFPMLTADEEYMLAHRYQDHDDTEAAHKLVTSHLRLVAKIAFGYRGYGLPMADLVAEGNTGLMRAVQKFDPERGFRLSTYAMWWIRAAVTEYILQSWSMVKLGTMAAQKKLFFSLRKAKRQLNIYDNGELSPEEADQVAEKLGVTGREALEMNRRLAARDFSLNTPMPKDEGMEYLDTLSSDAPSPEALVADAEEREQEIIKARFLSDDPITLEKLGERFGVSRERVRQLEARAFKKIQESVLTQHSAA